MTTPRDNPEERLQRAVVEFLAMALPLDAIFTAFPAGGGGKVRGVRLKRMGLCKGWPDVQILVPSVPLDHGAAYGWAFICLELKSKRGVLSPEQKECHQRIRRAGGSVAIVRSVDDCERALRSHCVPLRATLGRAA